MKRFLVVVVLLLIAVAALGFYRGWFSVSMDNTEQRPSATITVDQGKITEDENKVKERVQGFGSKTKETTGDDAEKVR